MIKILSLLLAIIILLFSGYIKKINYAQNNHSIPVKSTVYYPFLPNIISENTDINIKNNDLKLKENNWKVTTFVGGSKAGYKDDLNGKLAKFDGLLAISYYKNNLYVCDFNNNRIRKIDLISSQVQTYAGNGNQGILRSGFIDKKNKNISNFRNDTRLKLNLSSPTALSWYNNNLLVAIKNVGIIKIKEEAKSELLFPYKDLTKAVTGNNISKNNIYINDPKSILTIGEGIYLSDSALRQALKLVGSDSNHYHISKLEKSTNNLNYPLGIGYDQDRIVINDFVKQTTYSYNMATGEIQDIGQKQKPKNYYPTGITTDNKGNIFIADYGGNRIWKVDRDNNYTIIAGGGKNGASNAGGHKDGLGIEAIFDRPYDIIYHQEKLYVTEKTRIRQLELVKEENKFKEEEKQVLYSSR